MKYYIVKITETATENNKRFAGDTATWWYGKGCEMVGADDPYLKRPVDSLSVRLHGYKTMARALRSWAYQNAESNEMWTVTREVVEAEA